jgi:hypothetical protein
MPIYQQTSNQTNLIDDKTQQQKNPSIPTKLTLFRNEKVVPKRKFPQCLLGCVECSTPL